MQLQSRASLRALFPTFTHVSVSLFHFLVSFHALPLSPDTNPLYFPLTQPTSLFLLHPPSLLPSLLTSSCSYPILLPPIPSSFPPSPLHPHLCLPNPFPSHLLPSLIPSLPPSFPPSPHTLLHLPNPSPSYTLFLPSLLSSLPPSLPLLTPFSFT